MLSALLILLLASPGTCIFVDQRDAGVALVRHHDGRVEERALDAREGERICPWATAGPLGRRLPHRALPPGIHAIETLQE